MANKIAKVTSILGKLIRKIPVVEKGMIDEFLIVVGTSIDENEKKQLEKTMNFFIQCVKIAAEFNFSSYFLVFSLC